jgi:hypothetical protein
MIFDEISRRNIVSAGVAAELALPFDVHFGEASFAATRTEKPGLLDVLYFIIFWIYLDWDLEFPLQRLSRTQQRLI